MSKPAVRIVSELFVEWVPIFGHKLDTNKCIVTTDLDFFTIAKSYTICMNQNNPTDSNLINMRPENNFEKLERENLETLIRIERKLDEISEKVDRNTARINFIMKSLPQIPVTPVRVSELEYDYKNKILWADERYYINFDGKQAELLARLFTKAGKPKKTPLLINTLVEESYDYATSEYLKPRTFYLRGKEVEKKINDGFRTPNLLTVTLKEIYFNHNNREQ